jgi:2-keto-4-pentenoate hydratase
MKAEQLFKAGKKNNPLPLGTIEVHSDDEAYTIQDEVVRLKSEDGDALKGYKISLTNEETQQLFKSDKPLYGAMPESVVIESISLTEYNSPLAEMELIFLVEETLLPTDTDEEILSKCKVAPGVEIPDGRYEDWFPNMSKYEVIADCAVSGAVIFGEARSAKYEEMNQIKGTLKYNGEVIKEGYSTEALGHPVKAVKWLIDALAETGKSLAPGMFVSSGTFNMPVKLEVGTYTVEYEHFGEISFEVKA